MLTAVLAETNPFGSDSGGIPLLLGLCLPPSCNLTEGVDDLVFILGHYGINISQVVGLSAKSYNYEHPMNTGA